MSELQQLTVASTSFLPRDTSAPQRRFTPAAATEFATTTFSSPTGFTGSRLLHEVQTSRTLEELQNDAVFGKLWQAAPSREAETSPLAKARDDRLAILARKYEGAALTREDEARVAILTQRLRRLAPRVTKMSWTIAEEALQNLESVSEVLDEIEAKYGL